MHWQGFYQFHQGNVQDIYKHGKIIQGFAILSVWTIQKLSQINHHLKAANMNLPVIYNRLHSTIAFDFFGELKFTQRERKQRIKMVQIAM